jgi:hypothetical protein
MQRKTFAPVFVALALGLLAAGAAAAPGAGDRDDVRGEIRDLTRVLETQRKALLLREIGSYLEHAEAQAQGAASGGVEGVTLHARVTILSLYTAGADPTDWESTTADVDLDFGMEITDNLELFIVIGADTEGHFPAAFRSVAVPTGATLSGLFDGIGVDGTVSTSPGSGRVDEAAFRWAAPAGDYTLHVMAGKLDPRNYFLRNAFADDENTQFTNNLFDDPPAITWPTNATGRTILGLHFWSRVGEDEQYRIDVAYYDTPGQFFNDGQVFLEVSWRGDVAGREMNIRVTGLIDLNLAETSGSGGVSIDWWATDRIGVFFRAALHDNLSTDLGETNHIESSWEVGAVFNGLIPSRPDDQLGVAWGMIKGPVRAVLPTAPENSEMVIEVYYRLMAEDGKLQITPMAQVILDPGAGTFNDDTLLMVGLRVHVPF